MKIAIIDYEAGNKRSVLNALHKLGYQADVTNNIKRLQSADKIIFPGVGQAKFAMHSLQNLALDSFLRTSKKPLLGICLGMQLIGQLHHEGPVGGLGIIDTDVLPFQTALKIPHLGWNRIHLSALGTQSLLFDGISSNDFFYFIHSFYMPEGAYTSASCNYDISFTAALEYEHIYATQFHPEKSGKAGLQVLKNFIEKC